MPKEKNPERETMPEAPVCPHCAEKPLCRAGAVVYLKDKIKALSWRCPLCGADPKAKPAAS